MQFSKRTRILVALSLGVLLVIALYALTRGEDAEVTPTPPVTETPTDNEPVVEMRRTKVIGTSVNGREIIAHEYGTGDTHILFVGGIHGGYEWNSTLLAYKYIDHLDAHYTELPESVTVSVIPALNPDGIYTVTQKEGRFTEADVLFEDTTAGMGRFNANNVDLNRNFACKWQPKSTWRGNEVSAGTYAFSEPEAQALKLYVETMHPDGVVFWHSQANAVYASECENGVLPSTYTLMNTYANAAGYKSVATFDAYPVTGDAEGWLASIGIPAITVELATHETLEWDKNLQGINALVSNYGK